MQSLPALWLFQPVELSLATAGTIFFWTGVLSAGSDLVAARLARRFGLVNTLVYTHLPSDVLLILAPFMHDVAACARAAVGTQRALADGCADAGLAQHLHSIGRRPFGVAIKAPRLLVDRPRGVVSVIASHSDVRAGNGQQTDIEQHRYGDAVRAAKHDARSQKAHPANNATTQSRPLEQLRPCEKG